MGQKIKHHHEHKPQDFRKKEVVRENDGFRGERMRKERKPNEAKRSWKNQVHEIEDE